MELIVMHAICHHGSLKRAPAFEKPRAEKHRFSFKPEGGYGFENVGIYIRLDWYATVNGIGVRRVATDSNSLDPCRTPGWPTLQLYQPPFSVDFCVSV